MAIQFRCPGCAQPIEVDDVHAGQTAACPYCRRVVNVPTESVLGDQPVTARPAAGDNGARIPDSFDSREPDAGPPPPISTPVGLHVGPALSHRAQSARTFGTYALICTALAALLFGAAFACSVSQVMPELAKNPGSQPSPEQMAALEAKLGANPWTGAAVMGGAFFALVGLALGITSLVQGRRANWRAVVSVVFCGLAVLCFCGGAIIGIASGLGAPAYIP